MKINALNAKVDNIFNQLSKNNQWHFITFLNYKFKEFETRWNTHNKELYTIIRNFKIWRHYLQSNRHLIHIISDYNNFRYFITTKKLNAKQIRWIEKLIAFNFIIEYRKRKLNFANASSKKSDIIKSNNNENNNDNFLLILRNKLRNQKYQLDL